MDEADLDPEQHRTALSGLSRVNAVSLSVASVWRPLSTLIDRRPGEAMSVIDVASGGGDVAVGLAERARRRGARLTSEGCDVSPTAIHYATSKARKRGVDVRFFAHDVIRAPLPRAYDVVTCALFLHHLDDQTAVRMLREWYAAARLMLVISDLNRSVSGLGLAWVGTHLLSASPIVHTDAMRSVRAAFTVEELRALVRRAGLPTALTSISRQWPCRWRLVVAHGGSGVVR